MFVGGCVGCVAVMLHTWNGEWPIGVEEGGVGSTSMLFSVNNTNVDVGCSGGGRGFFFVISLLLLLLLSLSFL